MRMSSQPGRQGRSPVLSCPSDLSGRAKPLAWAAPSFVTLTLALTLVSVAGAGGAGCGPSSVPDPFAFDPGFEPGPDGGDGDADADTPPDGAADPELGGPCVDDGQCDDGIACTLDACDMALQLCRFTPDDSVCQNGFFCDGVERCSTKSGCLLGEPVGCSDTTPCSIDACDESTHACTHAPRDADGDGDPDGHCPEGDDCDDNDPKISSLTPEICGSGKDDDCDGIIDESACSSPAHDTCADPLEIAAPGSYAVDTTGAAFNYATSCAKGDQAALRDVVAALILAPGAPVDVEVTARTASADVSVALASQCGDQASEIACGTSYPAVSGGKVAKLRGRSLGSAGESVALPLYVTTAQSSPVTLEVSFLPPAPAPTNETCGTALPITLGEPAFAQILEPVEDIASECATPLGELVYTFELAQPANVDVYAASADGDGLPSISLRGSGCALPEDEITCQTAPNAHILRHSLPAGKYFLAVSASAPTTAIVTVELSPPTPADADEICAGAPPLAPNTTIDVNLEGHQDDVHMGCFPGMADAAFELTLAKPSDVLLVQRISQADIGAVELAQPSCAESADQIVCGSGTPSPVRAAAHNVPAGSYRVVAESLQAKPVQLTAFVRDAVAPTLLPFSDGCADAIEIPPQGGFFQGTTANANADFNAGCDQGGVAQGGAPDQLLKLVLPAKKRVVLEMAGSAYSTLLDVRKGPSCPGTEVQQGCAVGYGQRKSFLDLDLDAGVYYVQIDGYALDNGPWFLDVRIVDP